MQFRDELLLLKWQCSVNNVASKTKFFVWNNAQKFKCFHGNCSKSKSFSFDSRFLCASCCFKYDEAIVFDRVCIIMIVARSAIRLGDGTSPRESVSNWWLGESRQRCESFIDSGENGTLFSPNELPVSSGWLEHIIRKSRSGILR